MKKLTLQQFYQDRFNSDPKLLLEHHEAFSELSAAASYAYIDWSSVSGNVEPSNMGGSNNDKFTGNISVTETKYKGRVAVYSNRRTSDDGTFDYPTVNFVLKGDPAGGWSGSSLLARLYKEHKGTITEDDKRKWQRENEAKQKALLVKQNASKQKELKKELEKQRLNDEYNRIFESSIKENGQQNYIKNKKITGIEQYIDIRRCIEFDNIYSLGRKGQEFLAIRFFDMNGQYAGIQRIYEDGTKLNSPGFKFKNGAHCIIGDLDKADIVYDGEGFATCASTFLAMHNHNNKIVAVIVGINSGNLKKVLAAYKYQHPDLKQTHLSDNDQWKNQQGKGNAGLLLSCYAVDELGYKSVVPNFDDYTFDNIELDKRPTDFNDLHCLAGLSEVSRQLRAQANRFKSSGKTPFEKTCRQLQYTAAGYIDAKTKLPNAKIIMSLANKALQQGVQLYPIHFDRTQIINKIFDSTKHTHQFFDVTQYFNELVSRLDWIIQKRIANAQAFRSFSQETLTKPHINYKKFSDTKITTEIFNYIKNLPGIVIVRAPMGSGKTQHMLSPLMENAEKGVYFAHRVSLIASSVGNLNKRRTIHSVKHFSPVKLQHLDHIFVKSVKPLNLQKLKPADQLVQNYQDFKGTGMGIFARSVDQMGLCINSINNPSFAPLLADLDISAFDEAAQTLRHVADGSACDNPEAVYNAMLRTIKNTKGQVILCDADANDEIIEMCEQARPGEIVHVIELNTDFSDIKIKFTDNGDQVFNQVFKAVEKDERVLVANDSANNGKSMYESLKHRWPEKKFLFIYQNSKGNADVEAFNQNPDLAVEQQQYDAVIYSPCISSGVSLESGYFTKHFAILCGSVAPSDAIQMIRRDRNAKEFIIGFNKQNTRYPETSKEIILGMLLADQLSHANFELNGNQWDSGGILSRFDMMRINVIAKQNTARNDFANNMLLILKGDKYQIERLAQNELEKSVGNAQREIGSEIAIERDIDLQLHEETPDDATADKLRKEDCISEAEQAQLKRHDIENQLCSNVSPDTISFNNNHGITKVKRFELLQGTLEQAWAFDESEAANNVLWSKRERKAAKITLLHKAFAILGINKKTGKGEFTGEQMRELRDTLLANEEAIQLFNAVKIGPYVHPKSVKSKCETSFTKNILNRLGLDLQSELVGKTRKRISSVCASSWSTMQNYFELRQAKGISSLQPLQYDTDDMVQERSGLSINISMINKVDHQKMNFSQMADNALWSRVSEAINGLNVSFEMAISLLDAEAINQILNNEMPVSMLRSYFSSKDKYERQLAANY